MILEKGKGERNRNIDERSMEWLTSTEVQASNSGMCLHLKGTSNLLV